MINKKNIHWFIISMLWFIAFIMLIFDGEYLIAPLCLLAIILCYGCNIVENGLLYNTFIKNKR